MFDAKKWARPHILTLKPYSSARDEFSGQAGIFLDANENPLGSVTAAPYNRYPDPHQRKLKARLAALKGVRPSQIFLGNGSDEAIDLLYRAFAEPHRDNTIVMPPTYGMYEVSAEINCIEVRHVALSPEEFQIRPEAVWPAIDAHTKIIWVCSPNNPTANNLNEAHIEQLLKGFGGLVVVDEAYIDFAQRPSWTARLDEFPNLVVLQTFSKAWGLAALRLGMAFASEQVLEILNKIKPPYNIGEFTQQHALEGLEHWQEKDKMVAEILHEREKLQKELLKISAVQKVYPSNANFILVKVKNARQAYDFLVSQGIVVRDRSRVLLCDDCLRITVGTASENQATLNELAAYAGQVV